MFKLLNNCTHVAAAAAAAKSLQLCLTLSDLMDCSLPGSSVHGIFQKRVLELVTLTSPALLLHTSKVMLKIL